MRRIFITLACAFVLLLAVMIGRTLMLQSKQIKATPATALQIDRQAALARFARAIQFRTVSSEPATSTA